MENEIKKGKVIKSNAGVILFAGSKLCLTDENGEILRDENGAPREYMLGSDISLVLNSDMRLFETEA